MLHDNVPSTDPSAPSAPAANNRLIFGGLISRLIGTRDRTTEKTPDRSLEKLEHELAEMVEKADARIQERESTGIGFVNPSVHSAQRTDPRLLLRQEREEARAALEADIALLHDQLGTAVDKRRRERLRLLMAAHAPTVVEPPRSSIEARIDRSVREHLFAQSSEAAWSRLEELMERTGLAWPVRDGLPAFAYNRLVGGV